MSIASPVAGATQRPDTTAASSAPSYITAKGRDLRIDLLRGLCVLYMVIDHISGESLLYVVTGGGRFLTSGAEGFVLVSGFTAGMVYQRHVERSGLVFAMTKALNRAFSLYLLTVGVTLLLAPVSEFFGLAWATGLDLTRSAKFVVSVLTLHRTYPFADIMLLYTLLFLALPVALLFLKQGRTGPVLGASWLLWLVYQVYPDVSTFPWDVTGGQSFAFSSWQVLFFTALVLGYHRERLPRLSRRALNGLHWIAGLGFLALLGLYALLRLPPDSLPAALAGMQDSWAGIRGVFLDRLFDRGSAAPGRLVASSVVFGFLLLSLTRWWQPLARALQGLLLPFGQHALYAWTAHMAPILAFGLLLHSLGIGEDQPVVNLVLQLVAVAVVWLLTRYQVLVVNARNRRYWYAAPAALAVAALLFLQLPHFDTPPEAGTPPSVVSPPRITP